jgi:succinyl-CoA synthetase beta subunit
MLLLEHEGKEVLREYGIPVPRGTLVDKAELADVQALSLPFPAIVKAQVPVGGRGKAGGILPASSAAEFEAVAAGLFAADLKGFPVSTLLVEERETPLREYYLSIMFVGEEMLLLVGARGGVEVESFFGNARDEFATVTIDAVYGLPAYRLRDALAALEIRPALWGKFTDVASRLTRLFRECDATMAEINPLAEVDADVLVALDARIVIDDGALFRQPRFAGRRETEIGDALARRMRELQIQWVPLGGPVGLIGSGAGCGVAIMDWIAREGSGLAAFVDLDYAVLSGHTEAGLRLLVDHYLDEPGVRSIIVNFTACGVRVDLIAEALAKVLQEVDATRLKPIYLHFEGNRRAAARETMRGAGFPPCETLGETVRAAAAAAREA